MKEKEWITMLWWDGGHMGSGGWIGMGFMIVLWIAVVIGIIYLVRYLAARSDPGRWQERPPYGQAPGSQAPGQGVSSALRILEERYARGEIDQEEFLRRKADLTP
jgi:putative membrane protein